ncbi:hypothetical protein CDL15_Pgr025720 [Punica granatum]|uniref:Sugar phosphate transporter domain-containing protein n=1 Tax=Punica granatum TaxID=22663 RepID=A0A218WCE2_PUNGR|nr:hypothetical protein CDL15_Pgr025720 [Punica granatum]
MVFGLWYLQNIIFNIYNKKALNIFYFSWFLKRLRLFFWSVWMALLLHLKMWPYPSPDLFHTVCHMFTCISFSKVAISFTHVIKSAEESRTLAVLS